MTKDEKRSDKLAPIKMDAGEVRFTRSSDKPLPASRKATHRASTFVAISPRDLRGMSPARRSAAAGWAGMPENVINRLIDADLPLVLEAGDHPRTLRRRAEDLARESGLPIRAIHRAGCGPWLLLFLVLPIVPVLGAFSWVIGFPALIAAGLAFVTILFSVGAWGLFARRSQQSLVNGRMELLRLLGSDTAPELVHARKRVAEIRKQVAEASLPEVVASDLRQVLREVDEEVEALGRAATAAEESLRGLEGAALRTRAAALAGRTDLSPEQEAERARLGRAVLDVEELERRRDRARQELGAMDAAIDEAKAAVGRLLSGAPTDGRESSGNAVEALARSARLAREALEATARGSFRS